MRKRNTCLALLILSACAEGSGNYDPGSPISPVLPEAPTVTVVQPPEDIDGEYAVRIDPVSYVCNGAVSDEQVIYAIANVVEQSGATFDLLARGAGAYYDFTHWEVEREPDGFFADEASFEWFLTPGYPPLVFVMSATGSATSNSLAFVNNWLIGWYDVNGTFHTECEMAYDNIGRRRYPNWDNSSRLGIDGQWRVWHETVEDSFGVSDEPRYQTIDTIVLNDDDSAFDLKWTRLNFKNVPRAADGHVNLSFWSNGSLYDISGVVENNYLDLEITWDWFNETTGALFWHVKDRYTGSPRFQPHLVGNPEPPTGAFNVELTQTADSCDGILDVKHYIAESLATDDGQILLWIGSLKPPPFMPNADGTFSFNFDRYDNWHFEYEVENGIINGDTISFTMHAEVLWPDTNELYCASDYTASGVKRYINLFPSEP